MLDFFFELSVLLFKLPSAETPESKGSFFELFVIDVFVGAAFFEAGNLIVLAVYPDN